MQNLKEFYDEQIALLALNDPKKLVSEHYNDDAEMIVLSGDEPIIAKGSDAITQLFTYYLSQVFRDVISTEKLAISEDAIMFEATIDTVNGPVKVYDAMKLKDGKIINHFSGMK